MSTLPRTPVQSRAQKTRRKIIEAASLLFAEKTYHGIHAAAICKKAGVATGSFYHYFSNKMDLFLQVITRYTEEISRKQKTLAEGLTTPSDLLTVLRSYLKQTVDSHLMNPGLLKEMLRMGLSSEEVATHIRTLDRENIGFLTRLIEKVIPDIDEEQAGKTAWSLYFSCEGIIHQFVLGESPFDKKFLIHFLESVIEKQIRNNDSMGEK